MEPLRELEEAYAAARRDPAFDAELARLLRDYVGRPTPLGLAARLSERLGCRGVAEARGPLPHGRAQDQQRPRPGAPREAHGQDARGGRDRRRPARGRDGHGVRAPRPRVRRLHGHRGHGAPGPERGADAPPRRRGARGRLRHAHAQGRDQRGDARLGDERAHDALPARVGPRRAPLPGDGARLPGGDRPRGARAGARGGRPPARPAPRLRRRRLERDRPLLRVPRGRGRADGGRRGGRALVASPGEHAARFLAEAGLGRRRGRAPGHADLPAAGRGRQRAADALRLGRASTTRRSGPSTRSCTTRGGSSTPRSRDEEALAAFHLLGETEGILPALESAHAVAWLVREGRVRSPRPDGDRQHERPRRQGPGDIRGGRKAS